MNKITEIVTAWANRYKQSDDKVELANKRYNICYTCPHRSIKLNNEICSKCGCPLQTKIFTNRLKKACPLDKWKTIDEHVHMIKLKTILNEVRNSSKIMGLLTTRRGIKFIIRPDEMGDFKYLGWEIHSDYTRGKTHKWNNLPKGKIEWFDVDNPPKTLKYLPILN